MDITYENCSQDNTEVQIKESNRPGFGNNRIDRAYLNSVRMFGKIINKDSNAYCTVEWSNNYKTQYYYNELEFMDILDQFKESIGELLIKLNKLEDKKLKLGKEKLKLGKERRLLMNPGFHDLPERVKERKSKLAQERSGKVINKR